MEESKKIGPGPAEHAQRVLTKNVMAREMQMLKEKETEPQRAMKNEVPKHIEVKLKTRCNTGAKIEVDRCTGPYVHFRLHDAKHGDADPLIYEMFGGSTVLLTSEEARQIGQKMLDFADHVDKYPDMRTNKTQRESNDLVRRKH